MYMRPLKVVLAEFVGDECQYSAPTWLSRHWRAESKSAQRVRSYGWVITYVYNLLATPGLVLPAHQAWAASIYLLTQDCLPSIVPHAGYRSRRRPSRYAIRCRLITPCVR